MASPSNLRVVAWQIAIRVPKLAYTLWNIASHFFDEGTRAKIQIADGQHTMKVPGVLYGDVSNDWFKDV